MSQPTNLPPHHQPQNRLTKEVGLPLAALPLDPQLSTCLLAAARRFDCTDHVLLLCGLLSVPSVWAHGQGAGESGQPVGGAVVCLCACKFLLSV
jgi:hypothetical protein